MENLNKDSSKPDTASWDRRFEKIEGLISQLSSITLSSQTGGTSPRSRTLLSDISWQLNQLQSAVTSNQAISSAKADLQAVAMRAGLTFDFFSRDYMVRLAVAAIVLLAAAYLNALASVIAGHRTPWIVVKDLEGNLTDKTTLPDVGHDFSTFLLASFGIEPDMIGLWLEKNGFWIPDVVVSVMAIATSIFIFAHPKRFQILRRLLIILAFVFFLRSFCVFVTQLPDAHPKCQAQFSSSNGRYKREPLFPKAFIRAWTILVHPTSHVTCGDMVFSMHTSFLTLCSMTIWHYCRIQELPGGPVFMRIVEIITCNRLTLTERFCARLRTLAILYCACGACLIIATRLHYTLDVGLAIYLNTRAFRWYHDAATYDCLKARKSIFLLGYGSILQWMEAEEIIAVEAAALKCVHNPYSSDKKQY